MSEGIKMSGRLLIFDIPSRDTVKSKSTVYILAANEIYI